MQRQMQPSHYPKFFVMLAASFVLMYVVMYLNTYEWDHVYFSLMRFYMTCLMIVPMGFLMLGFMGSMYPKRSLNLLIGGAGMLFFVVVYFLMRTQSLVGDVLWMEAMIPHHSIAILTSERANIKDPEVRKLADGIIEAQRREIGEMKAMIKRLKASQ
ncbi:DUF305 domain-containing protein [Hymenobacter sp. H14-R3]|uniref:DUF305 domain-containing protein n=1 Tax=Hymenobacter sp. H14-R3 TaxID=3046308 RepID=UPI0024B992BE|nr:DUF305 domain-containing protein [Hymenobacter sp. H14-R3]MDJ0363982.1 DUF305 domain-containing protein [Hymenobacter sp. H14-R3]